MQPGRKKTHTAVFQVLARAAGSGKSMQSLSRNTRCRSLGKYLNVGTERYSHTCLNEVEPSWETPGNQQTEAEREGDLRKPHSGRVITVKEPGPGPGSSLHPSPFGPPCPDLRGHCKAPCSAAAQMHHTPNDSLPMLVFCFAGKFLFD